MSTEKNLENEHLNETITKFRDVMEDVALLLKNLPEKYKNNEELLESLSLQYSNRYRVIKEGLKNPYFARIDFKEEEGPLQVCYIGKVGVHDFDNNLITVDWRSPIASLYYDSNIGRAQYTSPDGIILGEMLLKRQYTIEDGKLIDFRDVDTVSNDEMLKPYLSVNADNRLKNIVSSIQMEQNEIIRKYIFDNMIVQGVAGSGKTTVALHRIAYLAYNYRNIVNADQFMVIGPNKFFIHYISSVLPDLDVTNVYQLTYQELVEMFLHEKLKIIIDQKESHAVSKFKLSLDYKKVLDQYLKDLEEKELFPKQDFIIKDFPIFSKKKMKEMYNTIDPSLYDSFEARVSRLILLLSTEIKNNPDIYEKKISTLYFDKMKEIENIEKIKKDYAYVKKQVLEQYCVSELKKYFSFLKKKTSVLYNTFLKSSQSYLKNNLVVDTKLSTCDLPGLFYLHNKIHGSTLFNHIRHTVVDEAQDYGEFHFYTMKDVLRKSSFSIFGDLAQSIYDYKAISSWEDVIAGVFHQDCSLNYLLKSYRTTVEIMEEANKVLKHLGLKEGEPVIRHGEKVKYIQSNHQIQEIKQILNHLYEKNYSTIAIISRNEENANDVFEQLKDQFPIHKVNADNLDYDGGLCSIGSEFAKGLEFDAVILYDVGENTYPSDDSTSMKHLYVAMTRALHELYILYQNDLFLIEGE